MPRTPITRTLAFLLIIAMAWGFGLAASPVMALTINLNYGVASPPDYDPSGVELTRILRAAADYWESIIKDSHTITIDFWWQGGMEEGVLGSTNWTEESNSRVTAAFIRFNADLSWFLDPYPQPERDYEKYNMQPKLYRDLTMTERSDWFNGSPPLRLEVGHQGAAVQHAPPEIKNYCDLLSVALHEMGHSLGIPGSKDETSGHFAYPYVYDFDPAFLNGAEAGAYIKVRPPTSDPNDLHLADEYALMDPWTGAGWRTRPSAVDVLAAADICEWQNLDLPRKEMIGDSYALAQHWIGNAVPDGNDEVFLRTGANVYQMADGWAGYLYIDAGTSLYAMANLTNTYTITVRHDSISPASLHVAGRVETNHLKLEGCPLVMDMDDSVVIIRGTLSVLDGGGQAGTITGGGTIGFRWGAFLDNQGTIQPDAGKTLVFTDGGLPNVQLHLDGANGQGVIDASQGNLLFDAPLLGAYKNALTIGANCSVIFTRDAGFGGAVWVGPNGLLRVFGTTTLSGAAVTGSKLDLQGNLVATDAKTSTIATGQFDWDGPAENLTTTIEPGATLKIESPHIDTPAANTFHGTVNVTGGMLLVNMASGWVMAGQMNLDGTSQQAAVGGSRMNIEGPITVDGSARLICNHTFWMVSSLTLTSTGDCLSLEGKTTYRGGFLNGSGTVEQRGDAEVLQDTTMTMGVFDWRCQNTTVGPAALFTLNTTQITAGNPALEGTTGNITVNSGHLVVNSLFGWLMQGTLALNNTTGEVPSVGGLGMVVQPVGASPASIIAAGGPAEVNCPVTFRGAKATVVVNEGAALSLNGATTCEGGVYQGAGVLHQTGAATVNAPTVIETGIYDMDGAAGTATVTLNADLTLNGEGLETGAPNQNHFNGTLNLNGAVTLTVNNTNPACLLWSMAGTMNVSNTGVSSAAKIGGSTWLALAGTTNVDGALILETPTLILGSVQFNDSGDSLRMGSAVVEAILVGGSISGPGSVIVASGKMLAGFGTINSYIQCPAGASLLAANGTLALNSTIISLGTVGTANEAGILQVNSLWNTAAAEELRLHGGAVTGGRITNGGQTAGFGTIASAGFINDGRVVADGGTLVFDVPGVMVNAVMLNGMSNTGVLEAVLGSIRVGNVPSLLDFRGRLTVGAGQEFFMNDYGLRNYGQIALQGGTYAAPQFVQRGAMGVTAPSVLETAAVFDDGSDTELLANLEIQGSATLQRGAAIHGAGSLVVGAGSVLGGTGDLAVTLVNRGEVRPGKSAGYLNIDGDFIQEPGGTLAVELAGYLPGTEFDQVNVTGQATLGGTLKATLLNEFRPSHNDAFQIMTFGRRSGTFAATELDLGGRLSLAPGYGAHAMGLTAVQGGSGIWQRDGDGNTSLGTNWAKGLPNGVGDTATFGTAITAPRTVTVDAPMTLGKMQFTSGEAYTLSGASPVRLQEDHGASAAIEVTAGKHAVYAPILPASPLTVSETAGVLALYGLLDNSAGMAITKTGAGSLAIAGPQKHGAGAALSVEGGTVTLDSDAGTSKLFNLAVTVRTNSVAAANFGATQHLAALNLLSGTSKVARGAGAVLVTQALSIDTRKSFLDLTDNDMVVHYDGTPYGPSHTLDNVKQWIASGYANMSWAGNGIVSSAAAADAITYGLGYAQNGMLFLPYDVFSGEPVDSSTILVKFTYNGDLNLDGCVDDNDVTFFNLFYDGGITTSHYWNEGDLFGYDGRVDDNDVTILGLTYGLGIGDPLGAAGSMPEPATLALVALGAVALAGRRRVK
ncbi:MAG: PEP-CTERM sorting domain-containing protein [Planctomycetota bacterium]|nr:PEP-CTERM sorting domain-containing protein [Planctomycetota bacterium]